MMKYLCPSPSNNLTCHSSNFMPSDTPLSLVSTALWALVWGQTVDHETLTSGWSHPPKLTLPPPATLHFREHLRKGWGPGDHWPHLCQNFGWLYPEQGSAAGLVALEPSGEESWTWLHANFLGRWSLWCLSGVARVGGRDQGRLWEEWLWR